MPDLGALNVKSKLENNAKLWQQMFFGSGICEGVSTQRAFGKVVTKKDVNAKEFSTSKFLAFLLLA